MHERKNFPEMEREILAYWEEHDIFQQSLSKESPQGTFVFFEGPPTANGKPGIHHVIARAFKDIVLRYKTMQGYHVPRRAGWDTHGLPIELKVEKDLEISGKPDIEQFGIAEFNKRCKESVWLYRDEWEKLTKRMGYWLDMDHPYVTYENDYIESLWAIVKKAHERGLLYLGHKVVPHCPRCATALSSHEVAQGYKEVKEPSVYVKFKLTDEDAYVLSWTTTPWTLPGNVALAVGADITYARVASTVDGVTQRYYIARDLIDTLAETFGEYVVEAEVQGADLVGKTYEPLFPGAVDIGDKKAFYIAAADFVTTTDGTGIVHTAVMYGEDDYQLGEQLDLPKVHTVDENGKFMPSVTKWAGEFVKAQKVTDGIIADLHERGLLFKKQSYKHDYPFCWRCDTPLLYYAKNSWFIRMSSLRDQLLAANQTINWVPDHLKEGRMGEWLSGIKDWAISRERYWGTPLPIWVSEDGTEIEVIGSFTELSEKTGKALPENFDPHRPYIDEYTYTSASGQQMKRVEAVMDVWFDSGAMPFAQDHYPFENKDKIDSGVSYPAEYICEAVDQTRGWFYTLLAVAAIMDKPAPYKNVISLGHLNDKHGKKMSKSKGNVVDPWEIASKFGMDALRFHFYTMSQPGEPKKFDENDVAGVVRKYFIVLSNVYSMYDMYRAADVMRDEPATNHLLDQWIVGMINCLIRDVTTDYEAYDITRGTRRIGEFIQELSTWYIRRSRERLKGEEGDEAQQEALATTRWILLTLSKLMAPGMPFLSEDLYCNLRGSGPSVHLTSWPQPLSAHTFDDVLAHMAEARLVIEKLLALRAQTGMKIRQALGTAYITNQSLPEAYHAIIADEVNVKQVVVLTSVPAASETIIVHDDKQYPVALDIELTDVLRQEGYVRELTRYINSYRKELKLMPTDRIVLYYTTEAPELQDVFVQRAAELQEQVKADELIAQRREIASGREFEVNGLNIWIGIEQR